MSRRLQERLHARGSEIRLAAVVVLGVAAVLGFARCNGERAGARDVLAAQQRAQIQLLRAGIRRHFDSIAVLTQRARATAAPHLAAVQATQQAEAAAQRQASTARAAAADPYLTLEHARVLLVASADTLDLLRLRAAAERQAATTRIAALELVVTYVELTPAKVDALVDAQATRIRTLERGRPWYRKVLGAVCEGSTVGGGAGLGATLAGPGGAVAGAVGGLIVGAIACP